MLVLAQNPVLNSSSLNNGMFHRVPALRRLDVFGQPLASLDSLKEFPKLQHLTLSGFLTHDETSLDLPELKVLNFVGCHHPANIEIIEPFPKHQIRELAFHLCYRSLHNVTFTNFTSLKLLNFACNTHLNPLDVIDVVSNSENV